MKIYENYSIEDLKEFLENDTWAGARQRILHMTETELDILAEYIFNFAENEDYEFTKTGINDFVWFEWDEIREDYVPF